MSDLLIALIALVPAIIVFIISIKLLKKNKNKIPARVEKAKELGHEVKAYKVMDNNYHDRMKGKTNYTEADYKYEVDGKEYRYNFLEKKNAPAIITLYWIDHPKKAFWGYSEPASNKGYRIILFLLPLITFIAVVKILLAL